MDFDRSKYNAKQSEDESCAGEVVVSVSGETDSDDDWD